MNLSAYKELIVILIIVLIVALNIWLFTSIKKNKTSGSFHILKKSAETLKDPFKQENKDLEELSFLVNKLKTETEKEEHL
jgi:Tfp pilus assembly protein PilO